MPLLRSIASNAVELCCLGIFVVALGTWSIILGA